MAKGTLWGKHPLRPLLFNTSKATPSLSANKSTRLISSSKSAKREIVDAQETNMPLLATPPGALPSQMSLSLTTVRELGAPVTTLSSTGNAQLLSRSKHN
jgi:hypothetical protein